jgi:UDP-glucose:(heptosyl)LPS alpha-1,3-glucosyltransferase
VRIGLVIKNFEPSLGGAEHWTWQFAQWLIAKGYEVHVVASRFPGHASRVVPHPVTPLASPLEWAAAAKETLKPLRLDIVHDMGQGWHCDIFQPHGGSRVASFEHNLLLLPRWRRPLKRLVTRMLPRYAALDELARRQYAPDGRRVIALSHMVAAHMRRYQSAQPGQLRIIYNGVDLERFSPEHRRIHREPIRRRLGVRDEMLAFIAAHNYRLKGVPTLLRAAARLLRDGNRIHVAVAGGKDVPSYQKLAARLGAGDAVTFVGTQSDIVPYYAAADVYVQPTFYDPCSLVVLEALASGLPVITSRYNGASELMRDGVEGFIIDDPSDDLALSDRLRRLLNGDLRETMQRAARGLAENHSFERNCQEIVALYEEVIPRRRMAA